MYHFSYFKENDQKAIVAFLDQYPFALITGSFNSGKQVATQVPFLFEERDGTLFLQAHIMRNTDHHKAFQENKNALVVFSGPNAYVSAAWYTNSQSGSTWNYMSVHAIGEISFMTNDELILFMKKFTLKFESGNKNSPTIYDNLPAAYVDKMMPAIVGFEIKVEKLDNVFKLSQNRDKASYLNIISKLNEIGGASSLVATEMQNRLESLFPDNTPWDPSKFNS
ncbi:MAG: hypothetical protein RIQ89_2218 [Bacteroidota bacterium]|jgi:transcriptional regulator